MADAMPWIRKRIADIEHQIQRGVTYLSSQPDESYLQESWEVNAKGWREMLPPYREELAALRAFTEEAPRAVEKIRAERDEEWRKLLLPFSQPMSGAALAAKVIRVLSGQDADQPVPEGFCCYLASETLMLSHDATCKVWLPKVR